MKNRSVYLTTLVLFALASCRTVGVSREKGGYAIVSPPVANEMLLDHRQVIVIDFQTPERFGSTEGHIAGAISAPITEIEAHLPELTPYVNSTILVYGADADEGSRGARILVAAGFKNIILIQGGLKEWRRRGYQTVSSVD